MNTKTQAWYLFTLLFVFISNDLRSDYQAKVFLYAILCTKMAKISVQQAICIFCSYAKNLLALTCGILYARPTKKKMYITVLILYL
jgi:hypothetical protein